MKFMADLEALSCDVGEEATGEVGTKSKNWTVKWPSFTRCCHEAEHYTDELDRISGERRPNNSTPAPSSCPWGQVGGKVGGTYLKPKD